MSKIVLPLTTKYHYDQRLHDTQLMVPLPERTGLREPGWVYTHQIKTIDYRERGAALAGKIAEHDLDFLIDLMERVRAFIDPDSAT